MRITKAFTDHPATVGETYLEHLRTALGFSLTMIRSAVCCAVHAFLPFLFTTTGSSAIEDLHRRMIRQRSRLPVTSVPESAPLTEQARDRAAA